LGKTSRISEVSAGPVGPVAELLQPLMDKNAEVAAKAMAAPNANKTPRDLFERISSPPCN